jgi:hypothetical protein
MTSKSRHEYMFSASPAAVSGQGDRMRFRGVGEAVAFLRSLGRRLPLLQLRALVREDLAGHRGAQLRDSELVDYVARQLATGRWCVERRLSFAPGPALRGDLEEAGQAPRGQVERKRRSWIVIELLDEAGAPVPGEEYCVVAPDGTEVVGRLDSAGRARVREIDPGSCKVHFPRLDSETWRYVGSSAEA